MNQQPDSVQQSYQDVPYPGVSDPWSHLRNLQALAKLYGLQPADATHCRVLELGCASGRNLLPQAAEYPNSQFVGVDFSAEQIAAACAVVDGLSMTNIQLRHGRIEQIDASWGHFDYILCPGVYSWVPPETRQRILEICRDNLAPQGIAAVSYNAYPGWHYRRAVRDLMRYHVQPFPDRKRQISEARSVLDFVADNCATASVQGQVFRREHQYLRTVGDDYLFHDYLAAVNCPLYFHEFVAQAGEKDLRFLCDADAAKMSAAFLSSEVQQVVAKTPLVQRCQLLDYLGNTSFHCSLLCHERVQVRTGWDPAVIEPFHVALADRPLGADFAVPAQVAVTLKFPAGEIVVRPELGKAALKSLVDIYPDSIAFGDLRAATFAALGLPADTVHVASLANTLLSAFAAGLLRLYLQPPVFCREVSPRPRATPLNRWWAGRQGMLVNARHENVLLDPWRCWLLSRLDGSLDRHSLVALAQADARDILGRPCTAEDVESALAEFAGRLLLVD
jgi:SAM-dependent methyltransferase